MAGLGFFFLPLLEIKPNRLASGISINLLQVQGDFRFFAFFILALVPLIIAFQRDQLKRGWALVSLGNLLIILTLLMPAVAGAEVLQNAETMFEEGTRISNPRVFTSAAMATGLLGSYIVLFGGLLDLQASGASRINRILAGVVGVVISAIMFLNGNLDIFSIMVEFYQRGETLGQRFIEHFVFVVVALIAGLVVGIALGLWASRNERVESVILYTVGIIQTVPSLALFGVLLVPLARLGDQMFMDVVRIFAITLVFALVIDFVYVLVQKYLPNQISTIFLVLAVFLTFIPLSIFAVIFITYSFESVLIAFQSTELRTPILWVVAGILAFPLLTWIERQISNKKLAERIKYAGIGVLIAALVGLLVVIAIASRDVTSGQPLGELTIRNLGVSGIGTAPALIALTLYSLLPLVRNTYAGLNNIDPAIIDSGRGMGMTPVQIFFQIELPLAFPVIMAGVRNAGISLVGIAAVASIIGAGALGDFILLGVNTTSIDLILLGALPAIILAITLDALLQVVEAFFTSPGLKLI